MNVFLWIVQGLLAALFVTVAALKLIRTPAQLTTIFPWVADFSTPQVRGIAALELAVGLGLILPAATGIATILTPTAALGGLALATGGSVVHLRRREKEPVVVNILFVTMLAVVAWGRFGPYQV